jgi:hypothetical protein
MFHEAASLSRIPSNTLRASGRPPQRVYISIREFCTMAWASHPDRTTCACACAASLGAATPPQALSRNGYVNRSAVRVGEVDDLGGHVAAPGEAQPHRAPLHARSAATAASSSCRTAAGGGAAIAGGKTVRWADA